MTDLPAWLRGHAEGVTVACQAQPGAKRTAVVGLHGTALKIQVQAPPVEGAANEALAQFLAERVGVARREVSLLKGATSRQKVFLIKGVSADSVAQALTPAGEH